MNKDIIFLSPVCTHNIWGGTRLNREFGYPIEGDDIGECWGISAHPNGDGTVASGAYKGMKLSELWEKHPELFGNTGMDRFPLLIKIIDAKDDLSIQVHPDDAYAKVHENGSLGKTECWFILDCKENATLVVGHNAKTKEELEQTASETNRQFVEKLRKKGVQILENNYKIEKNISGYRISGTLKVIEPAAVSVPVSKTQGD